MSKFTIVGAGRLGGALGRAFAAHGHSIHFQIPNPDDEKYASLAILPGATVTTSGPPQDNTDMMFIATPWDVTLGAVATLGDLRGRILVDCTNPATYGATGMTRAIDGNTSAAQMIAAQAPDATVVKCFNQVGAPAIEAIAALNPAPVMGVAGDDADAKAMVSVLAAEIGFDPFDAGGLGNAYLLEALALLWMGQAFPSGDPAGFAFGRSARPSG